MIVGLFWALIAGLLVLTVVVNDGLLRLQALRPLPLQELPMKFQTIIKEEGATSRQSVGRLEARRRKSDQCEAGPSHSPLESLPTTRASSLR